MISKFSRIKRTRSLVLLAVVLVALSALSGCAGPSQRPSPPPSETAIPTIERISQPGIYKGYSQPLYREWSKTSQYVTVRDGTKLAVDIYRPAQDGKPVSTPLPVIWTHNRYHRETGLLSSWVHQMLARGYIIGNVDVRGGGASYGTQQEPFRLRRRKMPTISPNGLLPSHGVMGI